MKYWIFPCQIGKKKKKTKYAQPLEVCIVIVFLEIIISMVPFGLTSILNLKRGCFLIIRNTLLFVSIWG